MQRSFITVAGQKGGVGKSTLAAHLSVAFAKFGVKVLLIDTDPQHTITNWYNLRKTMDQKKKQPLECISSTGWKVSNEICKFKDTNIIVIDSPPHMETETKAAIRAADLVIVPCQPSPNDLWSTEATMEIIEKERKSKILVLNRCPHQSRLLKIIEAHFSSDLTKYFVGNRIAFANAMLYGLTAIETEPNSVAADEILQIAKTMYNSFSGSLS